jgi:hypothetical protein
VMRGGCISPACAADAVTQNPQIAATKVTRHIP